MLLLYIPKYILNFAADLVLTINTKLMMYKVSYTDNAGQVFSYYTYSTYVYYFMRRLEQHTIKSFTISLHETVQKGGQYEQQPE